MHRATGAADTGAGILVINIDGAIGEWLERTGRAEAEATRLILGDTEWGSLPAVARTSKRRYTPTAQRIWAMRGHGPEAVPARRQARAEVSLVLSPLGCGLMPEFVETIGNSSKFNRVVGVIIKWT